MSKYSKLLAKQAAQKEKEAKELCKKEGHIMLKETQAWSPLSENVFEVEYCSRCEFGIPIFA